MEKVIMKVLKPVGAGVNSSQVENAPQVQTEGKGLQIGASDWCWWQGRESLPLMRARRGGVEPIPLEAQ